MATRALDYTPEQVTRALVELAGHGGNCQAASEALVDDEFMVPVATLRRWKREVHAEQYRKIEDEQGRELERVAAEQARLTIVRAGQLERDMLEEMTPDRVPKEVRPQALRAIADVKSKNVDKLLQLTGRPVTNTQPSDFAQLLAGMAAKGIVKLNVSIEPGEPAVDVEHEEITK